MHNAFGVTNGYHFFPSDESPPLKIYKSLPSKSDKSPKVGTSSGPTTVDVHL